MAKREDTTEPGGGGQAVPQMRVGLRVEVLQTLAPGKVELPVSCDHLIKVFADRPVPGHCGPFPFVYTRGDVDLLPAGATNSWHEDEASQSIMLSLSPRLLLRAAADLGLDARHSDLQLRCQFRDPQIEHIALALDAERRDGAPSGLLYAESLGLALAVHLLGRYRAPASLQRGLSSHELKRLTDYIEQHLDQPLSLTELAKYSARSATHLKTLFKASTGLPVHQYVVRRRVERARVLLLAGKLPAAQIALDAGFSHQSHMARCMRKVLGVAPSALSRPSQAP